MWDHLSAQLLTLKGPVAQASLRVSSCAGGVPFSTPAGGSTRKGCSTRGIAAAELLVDEEIQSRSC